MDLFQFAVLVISLLDTQQKYFRTKEPKYLIESKRLEKEARKIAAEILDRQGKLLG